VRIIIVLLVGVLIAPDANACHIGARIKARVQQFRANHPRVYGAPQYGAQPHVPQQTVPVEAASTVTEPRSTAVARPQCFNGKCRIK
jgi:hypothetical protein